MSGEPCGNPRIGRARSLRRGQTNAERRLWARLRNRQVSGFKFRRQLPLDRYVADFACVEARLIVELDGGAGVAGLAGAAVLEP